MQPSLYNLKLTGAALVCLGGMIAVFNPFVWAGEGTPRGGGAHTPRQSSGVARRRGAPSFRRTVSCNWATAAALAGLSEGAWRAMRPMHLSTCGSHPTRRITDTC